MVADARATNEQIKTVAGVAAGTITHESVQHVSQKQAQARTHAALRVNQEVQGEHAGTATLVGMDSLQFVNARKGQAQARRASLNPGAVTDRGTASHKYGWRAQGAQGAAEAQQNVASYARVNQQVYSVGAGSIPANSMENTRAHRSQQNVMDARKFNVNIRGAHGTMGQSSYGEKAVQQVNMSKNQNRFNAAQRVNNQQRGELAGQATAVDITAREYVHNMAQQAETQEYQRVNEQVYSVEAGRIPVHSVANVRTKIGQKQVGDVRRVNHQVRGENAGKSAYGFDGHQLQTEHASQDHLHKAKRVNEEQRGEFAGLPTKYNTDSKQMASTLNAPKVALINEQVKHVGRGSIPADAFAYAHAKTQHAMMTGNNQDRVVRSL